MLHPSMRYFSSLKIKFDLFLIKISFCARNSHYKAVGGFFKAVDNLFSHFDRLIYSLPYLSDIVISGYPLSFGMFIYKTGHYKNLKHFVNVPYDNQIRNKN